MRHCALLIASLFALMGCIKEPDMNDSFRHRLVVEGRIEQGRRAVVMLSQNLPYSDSYDKDTYRKMTVWATGVRLIHGEESEELTYRKNSDYPTEYIYTSQKIIGEVGESYTLEIEYSGQRWRSECTIPPAIELRDIEVVAEGNNEYSIRATLPPTEYHCSIDCAINSSQYYAPTLLGIYPPSESEREIIINRPTDKFIRKDYTTLFSGDDMVRLRVNTLSDFAYTYWRKWEDNFINSINPIFPSTAILPSNISNNGMGIWSGYGTTHHNLGQISKYGKRSGVET